MPFRRSSLVFVALVGCANESGGGPGSARDSGTPPAADGPKQPAHRCDGPGYASTDPDVSVVHVSATVVDEAKNPIPKMLAQACGVNVCVNGATDDNGIVVIDTNTKEQRPAFKYGDGKTHAKFALLLGNTSPVNVDLGPEGTVAFDPPADGAPLDPGTTASSRAAELELAADMNPVKPDPFDFDTPDLKKFRAALVSDPPAAVDPSLGLGIVIALTPSGTELCPPAKLTVPNTPSWPAGSAVEVFLHGIDVDEVWAPYGGWAKVSDAVVSADGKSISTSDGGGLPALSVVGLRLRQ